MTFWQTSLWSRQNPCARRLAAFALALSAGIAQASASTTAFKIGQTWNLQGSDGNGQSVKATFSLLSQVNHEYGNRRELLDSPLVIALSQEPQLPVVYVVPMQPLPGRGKVNDLCVALPDGAGYSGILLSSTRNDASTMLMNLEFKFMDDKLNAASADKTLSTLRTLPELRKVAAALGESLGTCTLRATPFQRP